MAPIMPFMILLLSQLSSLHSVEDNRNRHRPDCPSFPCGKLGDLRFPYTQGDRPHCGLFVVNGCNKTNQSVQLQQEGPSYPIKTISQADTLTIYDGILANKLKTKDCQSLKNLSFPNLPYVTFEIASNITLCKCKTSLNISFPRLARLPCKNYTMYYHRLNSTSSNTNENDRLSRLCNCPTMQLPFVDPPTNNDDLFNLLTPYVSVKVHVSGLCFMCFGRGGRCLASKQSFKCSKDISSDSMSKKEKQGTNNMDMKLGLGIGFPVTLLIMSCTFVLWRRYKQICVSSNFLARNSSSKPDLESSTTVCFGLPIFSYDELVEATNNFDDDKVLGDGGFGTVYYGKLRDGREVAIKRLYQNTYKRFQQFVNEVQILTRLRHKNLVSLYGCTSRRSRELLLVYEFVPSGTVADHLHGDLAQSSSLTWPVRMSIAIETASALAYLHASDVIHRDVKTSNILLDDNFRVKVADFGLSRLFPNDVTHISTAPQGTPGYVDPEYHQCYQLTEKSDVYSFGVVLVELVSSMPAVDITRHRHEISLANLAINKIQKCAIDDLIDLNLGYKSSEQVTRMTTLVAELAFRCLQQEKELRPSMEEVSEELKRIQCEDYKLDNVQLEECSDSEVPKSARQTPSPSTDDRIMSLKDIRQPPSPLSVTDKWISQGTTPNSSE